jgi:tRNA A37 threonylcarbamoyladenosine dehydratase
VQGARASTSSSSPATGPHCSTRLQAANGPATAVIDACDQVKAKLTMAAWARASRAAFITVGAAGGKRQAHKVDIDDLSLVTHDPLLAQLRQRLRKEHGAPREGKKIGVPASSAAKALRRPMRPAPSKATVRSTAMATDRWSA